MLILSRSRSLNVSGSRSRMSFWRTLTVRPANSRRRSKSYSAMGPFLPRAPACRCNRASRAGSSTAAASTAWTWRAEVSFFLSIPAHGADAGDLLDDDIVIEVRRPVVLESDRLRAHAIDDELQQLECLLVGAAGVVVPGRVLLDIESRDMPLHQLLQRKPQDLPPRIEIHVQRANA